MQHINLGYACDNMTLKDVKPDKDSLKVARSCTRATFNKYGKARPIELAKQNLEATIKIIDFNYKYGIKFYRMSSRLFPRLTDSEFIAPGQQFVYDIGQFSEYFDRIGELAARYQQRLTFHPDHFVQIGTAEPHKFQNSVNDLTMHAEILDRCKLPLNSVMVVHVGAYKDKQQVMDRWVRQFELLPAAVKRRIIVENCERGYCYRDVLKICRTIRRPFVFDTHHHNCYSQLVEPLPDPSTFMPDIIKTWTDLGLKPKFHVSEQRPGARVGAHSDYVEKIPAYLLQAAFDTPGGIDVMIEAKQKERAVFYLRHKYPLPKFTIVS